MVNTVFLRHEFLNNHQIKVNKFKCVIILLNKNVQRLRQSYCLLIHMDFYGFLFE